MKKVFYIKTTEQEQTYRLNLTYFSPDTDYKYILNLLSGGVHRNFIHGIFTQSLAYDLLNLYLLFSITLDRTNDDDIMNLYRRVIKEIGSTGYLTFVTSMNEFIEQVFFIQDRPQKLNNFKI